MKKADPKGSAFLVVGRWSQAIKLTANRRPPAADRRSLVVSSSGRAADR